MLFSDIYISFKCLENYLLMIKNNKIMKKASKNKLLVQKKMIKVSKKENFKISHSNISTKIKKKMIIKIKKQQFKKEQLTIYLDQNLD